MPVDHVSEEKSCASLRIFRILTFPYLDVQFLRLILRLSFRISQIISGTKGRSETGEAALESARIGAPETFLKLGNLGHLTGQDQVKGQNRACSQLGLWGPHC